MRQNTNLITYYRRILRVNGLLIQYWQRTLIPEISHVYWLFLELDLGVRVLYTVISSISSALVAILLMPHT